MKDYVNNQQGRLWIQEAILTVEMDVALDSGNGKALLETKCQFP